MSETIKFDGQELVVSFKTEYEYWAGLNALEVLIREQRLKLLQDKPENPELARKELAWALQATEALMQEICKKFSVVCCKDLLSSGGNESMVIAPEGGICFQDWLMKMEAECLSEIYFETLCSFCPFSAGVNGFIVLSGFIRCMASKDSTIPLVSKDGCQKEFLKHWSEGQLEREISARCSDKEYQNFLVRKAEFECAPEKKE